MPYVPEVCSCAKRGGATHGANVCHLLLKLARARGGHAHGACVGHLLLKRARARAASKMRMQVGEAYTYRMC